MIEEERSKTEKKERGRRGKAEKGCAFHFILCGFTNLVCFGIAISNLGLRMRDKQTEKMTKWQTNSR